jgi:ATP-dependent DNA ligase
MYERKPRKDVLLCYPYEEKRLNWWLTGVRCPAAPLILSQPKYDGHRCRIIYDPFDSDDPIRLYSSTGERILSLPSLTNNLLQIFKGSQAGTMQFHLDGELYNHDLEFEEISSIVNTSTHFHPRESEIQFHCFDTITEECQIDRLRLWAYLKHVLRENFYSIHFAPIEPVHNHEEAFESFRKWTDLGYEGVVLRHPSNLYTGKRSTMLMKFKPKKQDVYPVVGWKHWVDSMVQ